jgi:hypothetical protein
MDVEAHDQVSHETPTPFTQEGRQGFLQGNWLDERGAYYIESKICG